MNRLELRYEALPYPYLEDAVGEDMRWGWITLLITDSTGMLVRQALKTQWDIAPLIDWFISNEKKIVSEALPQELQHISGSSIAQIVDGFYSTDEEYEDGLYDKVYEYRTSHGIRFGMRGIDVQDMYVAKINSSIELSFYSEEDNWHYPFDSDVFFEQVRRLQVEIK